MFVYDISYFLTAAFLQKELFIFGLEFFSILIMFILVVIHKTVPSLRYIRDITFFSIAILFFLFFLNNNEIEFFFLLVSFLVTFFVILTIILFLFFNAFIFWYNKDKNSLFIFVILFIYFLTYCFFFIIFYFYQILLFRFSLALILSLTYTLVISLIYLFSIFSNSVSDLSWSVFFKKYLPLVLFLFFILSVLNIIYTFLPFKFLLLAFLLLYFFETTVINYYNNRWIPLILNSHFIWNFLRFSTIAPFVFLEALFSGNFLLNFGPLIKLNGLYQTAPLTILKPHWAYITHHSLLFGKGKFEFLYSLSKDKENLQTFVLELNKTPLPELLPRPTLRDLHVKQGASYEWLQYMTLNDLFYNEKQIVISTADLVGQDTLFALHPQESKNLSVSNLKSSQFRNYKLPFFVAFWDSNNKYTWNLVYFDNTKGWQNITVSAIISKYLNNQLVVKEAAWKAQKSFFELRVFLLQLSDFWVLDLEKQRIVSFESKAIHSETKSIESSLKGYIGSNKIIINLREDKIYLYDSKGNLLNTVSIVDMFSGKTDDTWSILLKGNKNLIELLKPDKRLISSFIMQNIESKQLALEGKPSGSSISAFDNKPKDE